ncbi:ROK family protein [Nocardiopsis tropica]|uniref:polyphosphate--glucose phosphotransferase n=1 Tax=Tsukamurella strandjordii TaxID=147577 RepID=UPI0031DD5C3C
MTFEAALGIDVGGSAIKGGIVDLATGEIDGDWHTITTPRPATPHAVAAAVGEMITHFHWSGPFGMTVPAVINEGTIRTAANIDPSWIGTDIEDVLSGVTDLPARALNDADAAGLAEARYGAGAGHCGVVLVLTLGTGIGSAVIHDGRLLPNTELGHLNIDGTIAERLAAGSVKTRDGLSYPTWAARLSRVLGECEKLLSPDLIVLGGGISRDADQWLHHVRSSAPVVPAALGNTAGLVGAAMVSHSSLLLPR